MQAAAVLDAGVHLAAPRLDVIETGLRCDLDFRFKRDVAVANGAGVQGEGQGFGRAEFPFGPPVRDVAVQRGPIRNSAESWVGRARSS